VAKGILEGNVLVKNAAGQAMLIHDAFGPDTTPQFVPAPQPPPIPSPSLKDQEHSTDATIPAYGTLSVTATIYSVLGGLGIIPASLMIMIGFGDGQVAIGAAGGGLLGSSIACIAFGAVSQILIDLGRNSHKQTLLLERLLNAELK
jgi:hypothetical protein